MTKPSKTNQLFTFDLAFGANVGGCDEAGRGPLAGPLVCAACVMPLDKMIDGIDDSKKLTEEKRERLYQQIIKNAISYKVSIIQHVEIDKINILNATKKGMKQAIEQLNFNGLVLIDAVKIDTKIQTKSIIKGDSLSYNIAAASIIAKVERDRIMRKLDLEYPQYNFKQNKGYMTKEHTAALREFGVSKIHRLSYLKKFFAALNADAQTEVHNE